MTKEIGAPPAEVHRRLAEASGNGLLAAALVSVRVSLVRPFQKHPQR
ncbi:hypothetical protein [Streptomyces sp. NPDC002215]